MFCPHTVERWARWATDITQCQNVVTVSYILPILRRLQVQVDSLSQKFNTRLVITLKSSLLRQMENEEDC